MMRGLKLGIGWLDVVKFESRVTRALEIQEESNKISFKALGRREENDGISCLV